MTPTTPELDGRRQAIRALVVFSVVFFLAAITVNVVQALRAHHGLGIGDGHPIAGQVRSQGGHGWLIDAGLLGATLLADALLVAAMAWLGSRLPYDHHAPADPTSLLDEPWYVVDVPRLTRALVAVGTACAVAVALCGAILFPLILIRYGWR